MVFYLYLCAPYWWGHWGMAASTRENDFVHRLESKVKSHNPDFTCTPINIATWERSMDMSSVNLFNLIIWDYDVIVIRLGENMSSDKETVDYEKAIKELVVNIRRLNSFAKIFITGQFWPNNSKETAIKNVAFTEQLIFVKIEHLYNKSNIQTVGSQVLNMHTDIDECSEVGDVCHNAWQHHSFAEVADVVYRFVEGKSL